MVDVTIDDPNTWPSNLEDLVALADSKEADPTELKEKDEEDNVKDDPNPKEETTEEQKSDDSETLNQIAKGNKQEKEPKGVYTKDSKHIIPYSVLKGERDARMALEQQTATLTAEVQALKDAAAAQGTALTAEGKEKPAAAAGDQDVPAEINAKADQLREDYGDEFADSWLDNWRTKAELAAVTAWKKTVEAERATAENATRRTAEEDMQAAIDAVPRLSEWQADTGNPAWYQAANEVYQVLMKSSQAYRAMPMADRMELLPGKVEALYGESPHSARKTGEAEATSKAANAIKDAAVRRPASMSDIPGGETPAASEAERLENLSPAQLQATIDNIGAKGGDRLESFLRGVSAS